MLELICKDCGFESTLDELKTINDYVNNMEVLVTTDEKIVGDYPNYFYYTCISCNKQTKFNLEELLKEIRDLFVKRAISYRYEENMQSFMGKEVEEANGIVYCGKCPGLDGEGNCFKDNHKRCKMRG